ncbi:hypothetical protein WMF18_01595 [Sorangium sp. So ce315]|uniref:hypothetical protein n=1 Tax=Sorangium sp. So ce315 TaxID=3133299 RepID=UPI003F5DA5B4
MRSRFDAFGKNVPRDTLTRAGDADTEVEAIAASQTMDVWYVPDPARVALRAELGFDARLRRPRDDELLPDGLRHNDLAVHRADDVEMADAR